MARASRPIGVVLNSLPAVWKAQIKTSLYKDDSHTSCAEFGGSVLNFECDNETKITEEDLKYEVTELFKSDTSIGRVKIEFYTQKDGIWGLSTSVNCSRDDYEVAAEKPKHDPADPNTLIFGYMALTEKCKENGKSAPNFEDYVKLHNETIRLTNAGKAEPISTSLVNLALRREKDTLDRLKQREAELDAVSKVLHENKDSQIQFLASLHEKAQKRADELAEKLGKNPVAEGIKEALNGAAVIVEKMNSAQPGTPVAKMIDAALIAFSEKDPQKITDKVSAIAMERVQQ